jgi:hypothetical protein
MPEGPFAKRLDFQSFYLGIRQGCLQFSRTQQERLENCKAGKEEMNAF